MKKDTEEKVGPTLFHAALVSEPYIKGMGSFATIPLSEEWKDSEVIQIINVEEVLTLGEMSKRLEKIEKKLELSEDETSEEETKKETSEETSEEDESKIKEEETPAEESKEEETESSKGGEEAKEEEKETETEETETEETESETEEAKEGVELAESEKRYEELLGKGLVTPAEKALLIPLLASNTEIELSEGKKVASGKALYEYLKKQSPKFSLSENGTSEEPSKKEKEKDEIPEEIDKQLKKMNFSEKDDRKEIYKNFKEEKEGERESTPF